MAVVTSAGTGAINAVEGSGASLSYSDRYGDSLWRGCVFYRPLIWQDRNDRSHCWIFNRSSRAPIPRRVELRLADKPLPGMILK